MKTQNTRAGEWAGEDIPMPPPARPARELDKQLEALHLLRPTGRAADTFDYEAQDAMLLPVLRGLQ